MTIDEIRRTPAYKNAACSKSRLCYYEPILSNKEIQKDRCKFCGRTVMYNIIGGRIDTYKYSCDHIRDYLQWPSQAFIEIYGNRKPVKQPVKPKKGWTLDIVKETLKTLRSKTFS